MRWLALLLIHGVAWAAPAKPVRKSPPPDLPADRLGSFVEAVIADKTGDYEKAIQRYRNASSGKELAAIAYNVADLHRRSEDWEEAVRSYKKYLELAPQAPDRGAVQQLIKQLEATPAQIVVDGDDLDAIVMIDGKRAGTSPLVSNLFEGEHVVDRIGPESFHHEYVAGKPMSRKHIRGYSEAKGNVVMATSMTFGGSWRDNDVLYKLNQRFELPPGKYQTYFVDPKLACTPVSFTVPATGLLYVFVDGPRETKRGVCTPIKVTTQTLTIGGAK